MEERTVVAHGCRKRKKLICGMEGKNVVAYGPSPIPRHPKKIMIQYYNWISVITLYRPIK